MSEAVKKFHQIVAAVCMCIGAMALGIALGWTSNIIESLKDGELNEIDMDDDELGWTTSLLFLGAMFICMIVGWIVDEIGRKPTVLLSTIPFLIGWILIILAPHIVLTYIGRFLIGVAGGSFSVTAPLYTSEIAHSSIRGTLGTFFQLFITIGILFCGILGWAMPLTAFNVACSSVPVIFLLFFMFQPETPAFDFKEGNFETAIKTMEKFRGKDYDLTDEIDEIMAEIDFESKEENFFDRMKTKAALKASVICLMLMFYQQLCGINAVIFYSQDIFSASGSTLEESYSVIVLQTVQVFATALSSLTIDRFGRKILLTVSAALMSVSTGLLGAFYTLKDRKGLNEDEMEWYGIIPLCSLNVFIVAFSFGFGPIPWMASSEMFPPDIKTKCCSAAATFNWMLAFIVTKFYFDLADSVGTDVTFYIFTFISATAVVFVLCYIPETKDKTFTEIQELLSE